MSPFTSLITLDKTEGVIKNGQSRHKDKIGHKTQIKEKKKLKEIKMMSNIKGPHQKTGGEFRCSRISCFL